MTLDEKITERFELTTRVSTQDIFQKIANGGQKQTWKDLLVCETIDYNEIKIKEKEIEIIRSPKTFSAFRSSGRISIKITEDIDKKQTTLRCEILPFNGNFSTIIGFVITVLSLWTILGLLIGQNANSLFVVLIGWVVFGLGMYLKYLITKQGLIDYSRIVTKELTGDKKASR